MHDQPPRLEDDGLLVADGEVVDLNRLEDTGARRQVSVDLTFRPEAGTAEVRVQGDRLHPMPYRATERLANLRVREDLPTIAALQEADDGA